MSVLSATLRASTTLCFSTLAKRFFSVRRIFFSERRMMNFRTEDADRANGRFCLPATAFLCCFCHRLHVLSFTFCFYLCVCLSLYISICLPIASVKSVCLFWPLSFSPAHSVLRAGEGWIYGYSPLLFIRYL